MKPVSSLPTSKWDLFDDPEDVDARHAEVDPAEIAALLGLDVMQEQDHGMEKIVPA